MCQKWYNITTLFFFIIVDAFPSFSILSTYTIQKHKIGSKPIENDILIQQNARLIYYSVFIKSTSLFRVLIFTINSQRLYV